MFVSQAHSTLDDRAEQMMEVAACVSNIKTQFEQGNISGAKQEAEQARLMCEHLEESARDVREESGISEEMHSFSFYLEDTMMEGREAFAAIRDLPEAKLREESTRLFSMLDVLMKFIVSFYNSKVAPTT